MFISVFGYKMFMEMLILQPRKRDNENAFSAYKGFHGKCP